MESEKVKTNNLNNFVTGSGKSLSHATHLIIDLPCLTDNNDEIISALNMLKRVYIEMRIIVLTDSEKLNEDNKDLLRRIFNKGIYDILTLVSDEEIHNSIMFGKSEEQAQELFAVHAEKENIIQKSEQALTEQKELNHEAQKEPSVKTLLPDKSFRKYKKHITIAICSAQPHSGATHAAIQITKFLTDIGFKAAYLEAQESGTIMYLKSLYPQSCNFNERKKLLQCFGIPIYSGFQISEVMAQDYDFYIFDFGYLSKEILTSFLTKDIKILVAGSKAWELTELAKAVSFIGSKNNVNILLNFAIEADKGKILDFMEDLRASTYFSDYSPNPFQSGVNIDIYRKIFAEYLTESKAEPQQIQKKKGFLGSIFN